jgi:hypothetical protein
MSSIAELAKDGMFDGAELFDGRDYRSPENVVAFAHCAERLGLVRNRGDYFLAEFLHKVLSRVHSVPIWDDARPSVLCGSAEEGKALIEQFVAGEPGAA